MRGDDPVGWASRLAEKYAEMRRLRVADREGTLEDPKADMARLAGKFPGALREIDELPFDEIERRLAYVERVRGGEAVDEGERWAPLLDRFHTLMRGALCAKRWVSSHRGEGEEAFVRDAATFCYADDAMAWKARLAAIERPPRGRVTDLVLARICDEEHLELDELSTVLFAFGKRACRGQR